MELRDYQLTAIDGVRSKLREGKRAVCLVSPTGSGKTVMAGAMIRGAQSKGSRILFLAHRKELITQCSAKLDALGVDHGIIMANHPRWKPHAMVQVASVATLQRRMESGRINFVPNLIFIDECHHARAGSYQSILNTFPQAACVGLTATPWRLDGKGLSSLFQEIVVAAKVKDLIASGALVDCVGHVYEVPDLSGVKSRGGDYDLEALDEAMNKVILAGDLVKDWQQFCSGKRTVVFAVNVKHSRAIVQQFLDAGVPAEHLDDQTPPSERDAILARIRDGKTLVVSNVGILTEGWDCPAVEVAILARPTKSLALAMQMMGRVLRPWPGKTVARIHDHARVILDHGLPEDERDYSLEADRPKGPPPQKNCPECFCVNPAAATHCKECGCVFEIEEGQKEREIEVREGVRIDLAELRAEREGRGVEFVPTDRELLLIANADKNTKLGQFKKALLHVEAKGHKPGRAKHIFRRMFGHWPNYSHNEVESAEPASRWLVEWWRDQPAANDSQESA